MQNIQGKVWTLLQYRNPNQVTAVSAKATSARHFSPQNQPQNQESKCKLVVL